MRTFTLLFALCATANLFWPVGSSAQNVQAIAVNQVLGDGKEGRIWRQWRQSVAERPIDRVEAVVTKTKGGADTFLNLRFGSGSAFESGKQVFLRDESPQTVTWAVGGAAPGGQPLVMNAYKGEVMLSTVRVVYAGAGVSIPGGGRPGYPKPRGPGYGRPPGYGPNYGAPGQGSPGYGGGQADSDIARRCRRGRYQPPRIEIGEVRASGGLFSGKYRISGAVHGTCVQEAGYFENGRLKERIEFPLDDNFQRREFQVRVKSGNNGELRVYSTTGHEDIVYVDEEISARKQGYR